MCPGLIRSSLFRVIPEGTISVPRQAFFLSFDIHTFFDPSGNNPGHNCCPGLRSVVFPSSLEDIGRKAFRFCRDLISLNFPPSLKSIGANAFNAREEKDFNSAYPMLTGYCGRDKTDDPISSLTSVNVPLNTTIELSDSSYGAFDCNG